MQCYYRHVTHLVIIRRFWKIRKFFLMWVEHFFFFYNQTTIRWKHWINMYPRICNRRRKPEKVYSLQNNKSCKSSSATDSSKLCHETDTFSLDSVLWCSWSYDKLLIPPMGTVSVTVRLSFLPPTPPSQRPPVILSAWLFFPIPHVLSLLLLDSYYKLSLLFYKTAFGYQKNPITVCLSKI